MRILGIRGGSSANVASPSTVANTVSNVVLRDNAAAGFSFGRLVRQPALWAGLAGGAATLAGLHFATPEMAATATEILRYGAFGTGALIILKAGFAGAKSAWATSCDWFASAKITAPTGTPSEKEVLAATVRDIENGFDARLSLLMLADQKFLTKNLALYRDEYARLQKELQANADRAGEELREQKTKLATVAAAFDVSSPLPEDATDTSVWAAFFAEIESAALVVSMDGYNREDYVKLMQKRDLVMGLLETRANLIARVAELAAIEGEEFAAIESRAAAAYQQHRERIDKAELKLKARRILNDGDDPAYALLDHGQMLDRIAASFLDSFRTLFQDIDGRLAAAAVAEDPHADAVPRQASAITSAAVPEAENATQRHQRYEASQRARVGGAS